MAKIDTQIVHLNVPKNLLKEVEDYQIKHELTTKTSAILELIRNGLRTNRATEPTYPHS